MQIFLIFLFSTAVSFVGSLQVGIVNISVVRAVLTRNLPYARWLAMGGSLPEMVYASLAMVAGGFVLRYPQLVTALDFLLVPVFLFMGIFFLWKRPQPIGASPKNSIFGKVPNQRNESKTRRAFWKGFGLAMLNPQLLPFWFGVYLYAHRTLFPLDKPTLRLAFVTGTASGALLLSLLLAYATHRHHERVYRWLGRYDLNAITGWLLVGLAAWKGLHVFWQSIR